MKPASTLKLVLVLWMVINFHDSLNLLSKISLHRFINAWKILSSYYWSRITGKPVVAGLPISISIEPTTFCNLRCPECPSGFRSFTRPTGMLQEDLFKKVIEESAETLLYLLLYFQGEPYLHPKFFELVQFATKKNIYSATSTNAHYLTKEFAEKTVTSGLDRLVISIDGTTQSTYESYRVGGKLEKVIEGTKNLIEARKRLHSKTPYIVFQFLVVKPNEHQVEDVKQLGKELGVDKVAFKTAQVYNYENGNALIPTIQKYSRYKKNKESKYSIKSQLYNHCWKMWHGTVVTWDGLVVPCCFDKDAEHQFGSVAKEPLKNIWNNTRYTAFRSALLRSRKEIDICKNCTEGTKIWA